ncbi:MAG: bifunctional aspartate kinase/homoserine dehydrogenase I [Flavobacteriaceae bacterium]|nr:bifunctional aspartate kinase/homoserine dehydrogenase I [Flavobacteriaceae bacterium]
MKILKFGGTSIANDFCINNVIDIVKNETKCVVVVSALSGVTNLLNNCMSRAKEGDLKIKSEIDEILKLHIDIVNLFISKKSQEELIAFIENEVNKAEKLLRGISLVKEITPNIYSKIIVTGEILSSKLINEIFIEKKLNSRLVDGDDLIYINGDNQNHLIDWKKTGKKIKQHFNQNSFRINVIPGFICKNENGNLSTLGRGGSDLSASIIANILNASSLEIWTDVSGVYTANPKIVSQARPIKKISYQEAMELSHFGAKVIYPPTIQPLIDKKIELKIKNTFFPSNKGTLVSSSLKKNNGHIVKGITFIDKVSILCIEGSGMIGIPGYSKRFFEVISNNYINIIMITQASSEHSICIALRKEDARKGKKLIEEEFLSEIQLKKIDPIKLEENLANIAIVGDKMKDHQGISGKMFSSLGLNNVNIRAIAQGSSERNISIIINENDTKKALNTLHEVFFEKYIKTLNLFIVGVGNVGSKLIEQIRKQKKYLEDYLRLKIKVIAIANSKKTLIDINGIDGKSWRKKLDNSEKTDLNNLFKKVKELNLRNSIFIDNTADEKVSQEYKRYLENNIGVVTCNKIACADSYKNFKTLKTVSRKFNSPFLFETNVGAGLPVIDTLSNLIASGDQIIKIEAILSGSLNYIFNNFKTYDSFHQIVKDAMNKGLTEPDPRVDLSGIDVARKILILARESGLKIELNDVKINSFLPKEVCDIDDKNLFLESLKKYQSHFNSYLKSAKSNKSSLKYVARLNEGKAEVGLKEIPPGNDFFNIDGSDNIILFYTARYKDNPLIIKGAGAGAEVTASGIFGDIIRIGKR